MEHVQKAIEKFHNRSAKKKKNIECDEDITFLLVGQVIAQMYHIKL
jgi:hypothetical protein